jgi:hypothetical protein
VPRIRRGSLEFLFDVEEWTCVRYCYNNHGHTGPGSVLITGGDLNAKGIEQTRSMIGRVRTALLDRQLNASIQHGQGLASLQMFELVKKTWKLPYIHDYDNGTVVKQGTKRLGTAEDDPSLLQRVPRFRDVPAFMRAWNKLEKLFDDTETSGTAHIALDS